MDRINFNDLSSGDPKVKFSTAKRIIDYAHNFPEDLYADLPAIVPLLDSSNKVLKWTAIIALGGLTKVDLANHLDQYLPKLYQMLDQGEMITANNTIIALGQFAVVKPQYRDEILGELLKVEQYQYGTDECRNIVIGKVLFSATGFFEGLAPASKLQALNFAERAINNSRHSTSDMAYEFVHKFRDK